MKSRKDLVDDWNELHCQIVNSPNKDKRNELMANWLEKTILEAKKAYYEGEPIMDDEAFDMLENDLKTLRPESEVLKQVGSK